MVPIAYIEVTSSFTVIALLLANNPSRKITNFFPLISLQSEKQLYGLIVY